MAKSDISRRAFVGAVAGASALAVAGCSPKNEPQLEELSDTSVDDTQAVRQAEELQTFHASVGYNCMNCFLKGYTRDGKIVRIEPGDLPNAPERNNACQRCMAFATQKVQDENARVMYPMRRTGERGSGEFERISWEEAITEVADKLNAVIERDPRAASFYIFTGNMNQLAWFAPARMAHCLGASTWAMEGIMGDHGSSVGYTLVTGSPDPGHDSADYLNTNLMLLFGSNNADTNVPAFRHLVQAQRKGTKLIVVDPRLSSTASIADEWIPINPGTDAAFALAMMNVIINNDLHDKTWLANYSCAPLLVSDETGEYVHPSEGMYCAWDTATDAMVELDPAQSGGADDNTSGPESTLALTGSFQVNGVACHPTMDDLVAEVQQWTPERAAEITGVDAATIERIALEYANAKPAALQGRQGVARYYYSYETPRALATLAGLCGYIGRSGGGVSRNNGGAPVDVAASANFTNASAALFNSEEWDNVGDGKTYGVFRMGILSLYMTNPEEFAAANVYKSSEMYDAAITGNPVPIDFLYLATSNFLNMSPDANKIINEVFPNIDFIVTADPFWTWTAKYSDIVLPTTTWLESWDFKSKGAWIMVNKPGVEPMGESKSDVEIMTMLAPKVGVGDAWTKTDEEWVRTHLDSDHYAFEGLDMDEFLENGIIARPDGVFDRATYPLGTKKFNTATGRLEFYTDSLVKYHSQVPTYLRGSDNPERDNLDKYPLSFIQYHDRRLVHTQHTGIEMLKEIEAEPHLYMNPADAEARGIAHDDVVLIYNDRGSCKAKAFVTDGIIEGATAMSQGWSPDDFIEGHYQCLTHFRKNEVEEAISMTNAAFYDVCVQVEKA
ncbi:molybdopterin-dependent oxidoreductase [uncultured Adlercreutzia sp.]|uniref:molybdopterin-containing oxidoreductase family protein n=1 Tax=uncultured Adlercreutzia sp. TaxID=875803 RepID=UPI0026F3EE50|nr:molybdopterin-dependent oxidoreductase [uncultured Adlercreutzia sp.]